MINQIKIQTFWYFARYWFSMSHGIIFTQIFYNSFVYYKEIFGIPYQKYSKFQTTLPFSDKHFSKIFTVISTMPLHAVTRTLNNIILNEMTMASFYIYEKTIVFYRIWYVCRTPMSNVLLRRLFQFISFSSPMLSIAHQLRWLSIREISRLFLKNDSLSLLVYIIDPLNLF